MNNNFQDAAGFVPMKRNKSVKEREPSKPHTDSKGKKWQRNDNKRNFDLG